MMVGKDTLVENEILKVSRSVPHLWSFKISTIVWKFENYTQEIIYLSERRLVHPMQKIFLPMEFIEF